MMGKCTNLLTAQCGINYTFCPKTVLVGVLELCKYSYMLCGITQYEFQSVEKTIYMERFLINLQNNENEDFSSIIRTNTVLYLLS